MHQHLIRSTVSSLLWLGSAIAMAQTNEYPIQKTKDPAATEDAGIGSYSLTREHGEVNLAAVEAFDVEGQPLASCEIEWLEDSKAMTCTMPDGGLFRATWYKERAEFEDLVTGDHISLFVEGGPLSRASDLEPGAALPERGEWDVRGTKTWKEAESDWGHLTPIFGYLLAEVEITLGMIPGDRLFLDRRIYLSKELRQGLPLKITCGAREEAFCDSSDPCDITGVFSDTRSACCAKASGFADDCCRRRTSENCCANSFCQSICPLGLFCECFLDGWLSACRPAPLPPPPPPPFPPPPCSSTINSTTVMSLSGNVDLGALQASSVPGADLATLLLR